MSKPSNNGGGGPNGNGNGKPPVAPDLNQVLNSISLSMSKHRGLLASLSKHHRPTSEQSSSSKPATTTKSGGFSTLLQQQKSGSTTTPTEKEGQEEGEEEEEKRRRVPDHEEEIRSILFQPPNAGLGWAPLSKSADGNDKLTGGSREERELRRKMGLKWQGKGSEAGGQNGLKRKKVEESESEEE
ncbi:hypothetical protein N0V85_009323, partial [Neurospora sp. IMI 360204]